MYIERFFRIQTPELNSKRIAFQLLLLDVVLSFIPFK